MLKSLANLLWGEKKEGQVVRVEGSLFQGEDDVVFLRTEAVVQKGTRPFTSSLVVTRLYEEGEEPPAEGSDEVAELHFFVNPDMGFQFRNSEFSWADPEGRTFALVPTKGTSQHLLDLFEYSVLQGMYEMTYKTSSEEADEAEVLAFRNLKPKVQAAAAPKAPTTPQRPAAAATSSSSSATPSRTPKPSTPAGREASPSKQHQFSPLPSVKQVQSPVLTRDTSELSGTTEVFGTQGNLYWFSPSDAMYNPLKEKATVSILRKNGRHFLLHVHDPATPRTYTLQPLTPDMNPIFYHNKPLSFSYSTEEDGKICSWGIKILFEGEERSFANTFGRCITEMSRDEDFDKLEVEQQQSLLRGYLSDDEMEDAEVESSEEEDEEDEEEGETYEYSRSTNQDKNSHLTVSYNTDRSFVVRGNQIGVFKNTNDSLEFSTSINDVKTPKGKSFAPAKTMLHSQDKNMVLMDTSDPHSLYKMDLTRGEVVEEWKIDDYTEVKHFCPESKFAQRAPVDTFVGMSHNSIFMVDPRLPGNKQVKEQMKQYARDARNDFSSTATTEGGDLVVVSNKGDMRLFNNISKNAKTHLPGFGDPIIGVDVSADGKWVLATCKTYLIIIDTELKGSPSNGFSKPMGKQKPVPKKLQIRPEHIAQMGEQLSFTPAKFNVGEGNETQILTSTGRYVVSWNFRRVKLGHLYEYRIKEFPDKVVADSFRFGQHNSIVVTLPDDVTMTQKSKLHKPTTSMPSSH